MKTALLLVIMLALGAVAASFLLQDNGYVLINFRGYSFETSVPVLIFLLITLYLGVRLLIRIWNAPRELGEAVARARTRRAGEQITRGFIALGEGNIAKGERLLTQGVRRSSTPLLNYVSAARAAQMQGDPARRDNWLRMAREQAPEATNAILLTQAQLQVESGEIAAARSSLQDTLRESPNNPEALRMLAQLCLQAGDWEQLAGLLPNLRRRGFVPPATLDDWTVQTYAQLISAGKRSRESVAALINAMPRGLRRRPEVQRAQIEGHMARGEQAEAEVIARKALNTQWDAGIVLLYGQIAHEDAPAQLRHAEAWLRERPEDPDLLLTTGRLCIRNELWGKARSYLESSLALRPSGETWHELGQLMLRIGDKEAASRAFQKGLTFNYGSGQLPRLANTLAAD